MKFELVVVFLVAMAVGGLAFILFPDTFAVGTSSTLRLLKEAFPDWFALRIIQGLGGVVLLSALFFLYLLYLY